VLIDFFRGSPTQGAKKLHQLEVDSIPYSIPVICCQEILAGARDAEEWDLLCSYLETQNLLWPSDPWRTHSEAARIMFDCRARGIPMRGAVDCLIAQLTLENDGILLHSDKHFRSIGEVRPLRSWPG
jgi:predicted nucleic acid-binding protein